MDISDIIPVYDNSRITCDCYLDIEKSHFKKSISNIGWWAASGVYEKRRCFLDCDNELQGNSMEERIIVLREEKGGSASGIFDLIQKSSEELHEENRTSIKNLKQEKQRRYEYCKILFN